MKTISYLLILLMVFYLSACKKKSETPPTTMQLLSKAPWKTIEQTSNTDNTAWIDFWAILGNCFKDNTISYKSDLAAILDYGLIKCNSNEPQTSSGSWSLDPSGTKYSVTINGTLITYDILELSDQVLKIYFKLPNGNSITEYKATLVH